MKGEGNRLQHNLLDKQLIQDHSGFITDLDVEKENTGLHGPTVSVIIPAFNEEKNVANVISGTITVMDQLNLPYEIIFVDDGSTDKTGMIASLFKVKVLVNKNNRGKGYSLKKALQHARGDIIVTIDSDGEHKPKEIAPLLGAVLNGIDVAAGSRFLNNKTGVTTKLNQIGNHFFNLTIMSLTGKRVTDSQTGFRAIKREVLEKIDLQSDGYEIETEITVKSLKNGFTFRELPITVERRKFGASKLKIIEDGKRIMGTILSTSFFS
ncbi:glycosyltransferase family 2 protein [Candidatus Bathyarchaeota archaeon]|nr:glycosyltransferase family 2 protein [Candidatus Bathyarchaeota archaeon]